eukprot:SAG11_NODE_2103_length_3819_cov_2.904032_1_plen_304_part_00
MRFAPHRRKMLKLIESEGAWSEDPRVETARAAVLGQHPGSRVARAAAVPAGAEAAPAPPAAVGQTEPEEAQLDAEADNSKGVEAPPESEEPVAPDGMVPVPLRGFLDGAVVHEAQLLFTASLDPFVKRHMRTAFPDNPVDPEDRAFIDAEAERARRQEATAARLVAIRDVELPAAVDAVPKAQKAVDAASAREQTGPAKRAAKEAEKAAEELEGELRTLGGLGAGGFFGAELARAGLSAAELAPNGNALQAAALAQAVERLGYHPRSVEAKQLKAAQKEHLAHEAVRLLRDSGGGGTPASVSS